MKDWRNIFKDDNEWNEKSIVGFITLMVMLVVMFLDVVFTVGGTEFDLKNIYETLLWIVLGSFGISGFLFVVVIISSTRVFSNTSIITLEFLRGPL